MTMSPTGNKDIRHYSLESSERETSPMFIVNQLSSAMLIETDSEAGLSHFKNSVYARSKNLSTEDDRDLFEHRFPLKGSVQMDPNSKNER